MENSNNTDGSLYLFKNGIIEYIPLSTSDEIKKDSLGNLMSYEELNIYQYLVKDTNKYNNCFSMGVNLYNELNACGYSVIKHSYVSKDDNSTEKHQLINCLMSANASNEDMNNIYTTFKDLAAELDEKNNDINLYVYKNTDPIASIADYHYYNSKISTKKFPATEVLNYHIRKLLSEEFGEYEEKMWDLYENFDLEHILCMDVSDYVINHTGAGVIVISDDEYITRNLTRMKHDYDVEAAVRQLKPNFTFKHSDAKNNFMFFPDNNISNIRLAYGQAIICVANNPNKQHLEYIKSFAEQIAEIQEKNGPIIVAMMVHNDAVEKFNLSNNEFYDCESILQCLDEMTKSFEKEKVKSLINC